MKHLLGCNTSNMERDGDRFTSLLERLKNDEDLLAETVDLAKDSASSLGLLLRQPNIPDSFKSVPVTLLPTTMHYRALNEVLSVQSAINACMHRAAHDRKFLTGALYGASTVDPFVKNLLDIYDNVDIDGQWELGLFRSDYILHSLVDGGDSGIEERIKASSYKQVEVNTICVGLSGIGSKMHEVHDRVLQFVEPELQKQQETTADSLGLYGGALKLAFDVYGQHHPTARAKILLVIVHDGFEFNIVDQRLVQFASGISTIRRSFKQIRHSTKVDEDGILFVEGREVAVVYYRSGYAPSQYAGEEDWALRLAIERSDAIKCPSVAYQLAGLKKIQLELTRPEAISKFIPDADIREKVLRVNMGQWDLSDPSAASVIDEALRNPGNFVLKPNREGGGNNYYFGELVDKILEVRGTPLAQAYILMEKIISPPQENYLIRPSTPYELAKTISEIGVFGAILAKNENILYNAEGKDVLVRCKASSLNEGGLATGNACLSSAWIV